MIQTQTDFSLASVKPHHKLSIESFWSYCAYARFLAAYLKWVDQGFKTTVVKIFIVEKAIVLSTLEKVS